MATGQKGSMKHFVSLALVTAVLSLLAGLLRGHAQVVVAWNQPIVVGTPVIVYGATPAPSSIGAVPSVTAVTSVTTTTTTSSSTSFKVGARRRSYDQPMSGDSMAAKPVRRSETMVNLPMFGLYHHSMQDSQVASAPAYNALGQSGTVSFTSGYKSSTTIRSTPQRNYPGVVRDDPKGPIGTTVSGYVPLKPLITGRR